MNPLDNLANRWTPEEKATLARMWTAGKSLRVIGQSLPGKSRKSLTSMRENMRLPARRRHWTETEIRALRAQWGIESLFWISRHLKRCASGVAMKARSLGLETEAPAGWETFQAATERTGYCWRTLEAILAWAGVKARRPYSPSYGRKRATNRRCKRHIVDSFEVDEAIGRWHKTERLSDAANRLGTTHWRLRVLLENAGIALIQTRAVRGSAQRAMSEDIDRVWADHADRETLRDAATRLSVTEETLVKYLRIIGYQRENQYALIPREVLDQAAAMFRASPWAQRRADLRVALFPEQDWRKHDTDARAALAANPSGKSQ